MTIETCIKYLDYVANECDRHLRDGRVTDDELINLSVEIQRFKEQCITSDLPEEIRSKIAGITMKYTVEKVERSTWFIFVAFATFGVWAGIINHRQQSKRKETLKQIQFDASRLASHLRMNY